MKKRKIPLFAPLLLMILISAPIQSQSKSKEELGNLIIASIQNKDIDAFKSLLLPTDVVMESLEKDFPENISPEDREALMRQSLETYENAIVPRYEKNFWEMVKLTEAHDIDWSYLNLMILYKYASNDPEYIPFFIHAKINNSVYEHFYFSAVRYKGEWFFEDRMELTKNEKYSAKG